MLMRPTSSAAAFAAFAACWAAACWAAARRLAVSTCIACIARIRSSNIQGLSGGSSSAPRGHRSNERAVQFQGRTALRVFTAASARASTAASARACRARSDDDCIKAVPPWLDLAVVAYKQCAPGAPPAGPSGCGAHWPPGSAENPGWRQHAAAG